MLGSRVDRNSDQFKRGVIEESREHKSFPKKIIQKLVADHIAVHPYMYKK
jgi:hypothetical protein